MASKSNRLVRKLNSHISAVGLVIEDETPIQVKNNLYENSLILDSKKFGIEILTDRASVEERIFETDLNPENYSPDVMAYYVSFRKSLVGPKIPWGIYLRIPIFEGFCMNIARKTGLPLKQVIQPAFDFVWTHEINHFEVDLTLLMFDVNVHGQVSPQKTPLSCPHEESLGQIRGFKSINTKTKNKAVAKAIREYYESKSWNGYSDFTKFENRESHGFDEVVGHHINTSCSTNKFSPLASLTMGQKLFSHSEIPLTFEFSERQDWTLKLMPASGIVWSSRAARERDKKMRGDARYRKLIRTKLDLFQKDPHHPSFRTQKYHEREGHWEARFNDGERFIFTQDDARMVTIQEIGNDITH